MHGGKVSCMIQNVDHVNCDVDKKFICSFLDELCIHNSAVLS